MNTLTLPAPRLALNPRLASLILPVLFLALALIVMLVFGDAFAATPPPAPAPTDYFTVPALAFCKFMTDASASILVGVGATAMVVYGIVLIVGKQRGGFGWVLGGVLGYAFIRNAVAIARSAGLAGC